MGSQSERDTTPYQPPNARWLFPDAHVGAPPASEPGIVVSDEGVTAIRSALYRSEGFAEFDQPQVQDTIALIDGIIKPATATTDRRLIGMEGEMFVLDLKTGDTVPVYGIDLTVGDAVPVYGMGVEELHSSQIEANSMAFEGPGQTVRSLLGEVAEFDRRLRLINSLGDFAINPASNLMHRAVTIDDVRTDNPYIRRTVELRPEYAEFSGAGVHMHIDVQTEHAALVASYLRLVVQLMNLPMQASPFAFGQTEPRVGEVYGVDALKPRDNRPIQAVRYLGRLARLDHGGVGIKVAHDTNEGALRQSEQRLMNKESNHPARVNGDHADIRIRYDAVDKSKRDGTARIEVCVFDTGAYRYETLTAVTDLLKAVTSSLEAHVAAGEKGIEALHKTYPQLFGRKPGMDVLQDNLWRAEENSIEMSYDGFDAEVVNYSGQKTTSRHLFNELCSFGRKGAGDHAFNPVYEQELKKATLSRRLTNKFIHRYLASRTQQPSLEGFYNTGYFTASDWIRAVDQAMEAQGVTESDRWRLAAEDRALALRAHLASVATRQLR